MGELATAPDLSRLPDLHRIEPEDAYPIWNFELVSECREADILEVVEQDAAEAEAAADPATPQPGGL